MLNVKEISFENAHDFINYLRLSSGHWEESEPSSSFKRHWYFRGQMDTSLPLKPKSLRDKPYDNKLISMMPEKYFDRQLLSSMDEASDALLRTRPHYSDKNCLNAKLVMKITMAEILIVDEFVNLAQKVLGFSIPEIDLWNNTVDGVRFRYQGRLIEGNINELWKHPAMAIAQHHGIPTRLLDWTSNPVKAALFAAMDDPFESTHKLGVYAFHTHHFDKSNVQIYHPPLSVTTFLHAQEGLFTLDLNANNYFIEHGKFPSVDEAIKPDKHSEDVPPLLITLPATERFELFRQLWLENYTNAHLMPTLDNVAKAVKLKLQAMPKIWI